MSRQNLSSSGTVFVWALPMSRWMTGHFLDQSHSGSMARPLNSSRLPSKRHLSVETASDFPNRRGRAMKNCEPREPSASSFRIAVLSTYVKPPPRSFSNVYVSVAAFSTPHIIAQHLTQAQGDPRERGA